MPKKKKTAAQKLKELEAKLASQNYSILNQFSCKDLLVFLSSKLDEELEYVEDHIGLELDYIKWETDSYAGAKQEMREEVKRLRAQKRALEKLDKHLLKVKDGFEELEV